MIIDTIRERYTCIKPCCVEGEPDAHTVWLKVGAQKFCVTSEACETKQDAEEFRRMLASALACLVEDFQRPAAPEAGGVAENLAAERMTTHWKTLLKCGYVADLEIVVAYAKTFPNNCAIRERTADSDYVGPCTFDLENGTTCPRHGKVKFERAGVPRRRLSKASPARRFLK